MILKIIVASLALMASEASAQQMVTNGGFDTGDFAGWTTTPASLWNIGTRWPDESTSGYYVRTGNGYGVPGVQMSQTLNLNPGQSYRVSFDWGGGWPYDPVNFTQSIGSFTNQVFSGSGDFDRVVHSSYDYLATNAATVLSFDIPQNYYGIRLDNISVISIGTIPRDAPPPTDTQLARMSIDSYGPAAATLPGGYSRISAGVAGEVERKGSTFAESFLSPGQNGGKDQIVIAIRGSEAVIDFLLRNGTFASGSATELFDDSATEVAGLIATLHHDYPDAEFTLTGHSLGGGLAQAIGDVLHIKSVGFDAPGAKDVFSTEFKEQLSELAQSGSPAGIGTSSSQNYNIRYYGDVVSNIGDSLGDVRTVVPLAQSEKDDIDHGNLLFLGACVMTCHKPELILDALEAGAVPVSYDPDPLSKYNALTLFSNNDVKDAKEFYDVVTPDIFRWFDPLGSGNYLRIDMLGSDTYLDGIALPGLNTIFAVYALGDDGWTQVAQASGFTIVSLPRASAYLIDNAGQLQNAYGSFLVGLRFGQAGTFQGSFTLMSEGVPEVSAWLMMITGMFFIGIQIRRGRSEKRPPWRADGAECFSEGIDWKQNKYAN